MSGQRDKMNGSACSATVVRGRGDAGFIVVQSGEGRPTPKRQRTGNDFTEISGLLSSFTAADFCSVADFGLLRTLLSF